MNEAIVYTDDTSAKWEALLSRIRVDVYMRDKIDLSDSKADLYDFSNELRMQVMRESLLEALQIWNNPEHHHTEVRFGNKFFATMNEQQQRSFFRSIFAVPVVRAFSLGEATNNGAEKPAITIHTSALLDALIDLSPRVWRLQLENVALSNQSDVEALSNIILAKRENLRGLYLIGIECPIDYNGPVGFLDPLLYTASRLEQLYNFELSARTHPVYSSLVSTNVVRNLFSVWRRFGSFHLHGLGLNDSHCHTIAELLQTAYTLPLYELNLESNPKINAEGYCALLSMINRTNAVHKFYFDDKTWEAKLNLVSTMNRDHGRLEYMTDGDFSSEERRWQWLQTLASLPSSGDEKDAKQVNFIWYELLEHPEFMQT